MTKGSVLPAARVKRIMQTEDDIGKVATASPVVMAKATELFLREMVEAIEKEARAKSTKKVSMHHVKRAVENTTSLDFLKDLVEAIPDPGEADGAGLEEGASASARRGRSGPSARGKGSSAGPSGRKGKISNSLSPAPFAQGQETDRKVAIPISSLLGPGPGDGAKEEDDDEEEEDYDDAQAAAANARMAEAPAPISTKASKEEDEDYDE